MRVDCVSKELDTFQLSLNAADVLDVKLIAIQRAESYRDEHTENELHVSLVSRLVLPQTFVDKTPYGHEQVHNSALKKKS